MSWDYLVLGSGITGLAFGALASKEYNKKVLIVEKHKVPGGYASEFSRKRNKFRFECSLHKISGSGNIGNLKRILQRLDLDEKLDFIYPQYFFKATSNDQNIILSNKVDTQIEQLSALFPEESEAIKEYFYHISEYGKWGYYQFQILKGELDPDFKKIREGKKLYSKITVAEQINRMFDNEHLKAILVAPAIYVGSHPEQISYLYYLHVVYATLNAGNAYIKGGGQKLSNALVDIIVAKGGKILLSNPAEKINISEDKFVDLNTRLGNYSAKQLIVNSAPHYTIEKLMDSTKALESIKKKLSQLKPANSTTTLYIATKSPPQQYGLDCSETMIFDCGLNESINIRKEAKYSNIIEKWQKALWEKSVMEVTNYHALDNDCGYIIVANVLDDCCHWPPRQTSEYKQKKQLAKNILLKRIRKYFDIPEDEILWNEISSPHTYERYTNNYCGSGYGALVSPGNTGHTFHYSFPYKNISFMNSWTAGSGYEAAFSYAEFFTENLNH